MSQAAPAGPVKAFPVLALLKIHSLWVSTVNSTVPEPYLDEVFHIPQAQAYWARNYTHWDPKITTPPGLYLFSNFLNRFSKAILQKEPIQTTEDLRNVSAILLWLLFVSLRVFRSVRMTREGQSGVIYRELNIMLFPLFFFFSALYYTDLLSTLTVVLSYIFWGMSQTTSRQSEFFYRFLQFVSGLAALATRQTNIFWVAVFLGGLQVMQTINRTAASGQPLSPPVAGADIEDYFQTIIKIMKGVLRCIPRLMVDLLPQLSLLACFGAFIVWNGGVVLGDKDNHIASLHLSQMLYIWPFIVFFSWPLLLPQLMDIKTLGVRLPRSLTSNVIMAAMTAVVHYNTIVHPFTLADNRHYMFYVFRLLLSNPKFKYAAVPVYFLCAWLVINALGNPHMDVEAKKTTDDERKKDPSPVIGERVSFALVWLASTTLSLVTAPLVEPRYFMLPWLIWRLHVPGVSAHGTAGTKSEHEDDAKKTERKKEKKLPKKEESVFPLIAALVESHVLWIELAWYLLINYITCRLFLEHGFEWAQEPGKVQRFMW